MSYLAALAVVILAATAAGLASWLIRRIVGAASPRPPHPVGGQVFGQVGIMFSVLLSFVFSEVWSEYNIAAQAISHECGALHGAAMLATAMPNDAGRPVVLAIRDYGRVVAATEWPLMAQRQTSPQAIAALSRAIDRAASLPPTASGDVAIRSQLVALLIDAHANRETRTYQITAGLPLAIWTVLIALALVLDGFLLLAGTEVRSHIFLVAAAAGSTAAALVMVRMFDYPFEGGLALNNTDFVKMTAQISAMLTG